MSSTNIPVSRVKNSFPKSLCLIAAALALILTACSTSSTQTSSTTPTAGTGSPNVHQPGDFGLGALPGYQVSLFASGTSSYNNPDAVVVDNGHVFIDYQNTTAKDCTDNNSSTIVEYSMDGKVVNKFTMPGHSDGMRADPSTHLLWVTSCEDGNPKMATIDPTGGTVTPYTFPKTPHGGGYDDLFFLNGMTFIAASNPNLDKNGNNVFPALDKITLSGGKAVLTPVLMGNTTAADLSNNNAKVTLNEVDPDSLSVDTKGDLVLVNQAGSELVFLSNPGTPQQKVSRLPVGTQLDDTVWATSTQGRLLVVDGGTNNIYWVSVPHFVPGAIYTEAPNDSGVVDFVGVVDPATGLVTPVIIGFSQATGMLFVPNS